MRRCARLQCGVYPRLSAFAADVGFVVKASAHFASLRPGCGRSTLCMLALRRVSPVSHEIPLEQDQSATMLQISPQAEWLDPAIRDLTGENLLTTRDDVPRQPAKSPAGTSMALWHVQEDLVGALIPQHRVFIQSRRPCWLADRPPLAMQRQ